MADEILPQLRRARLTANYDVIGRSDEEINAAFDAKEDSISVDELLYAATLTQDNARKEAIYKRAIEKYPNDFRAYNNLGMMSYAAGDLNAAENYFKQAASKSANAAEVNTNLGLCELCKGNVAQAETYLSKSTGANTANEALGNLYIKQGQYDRAVQALPYKLLVTPRPTQPLWLKSWLKTTTRLRLHWKALRIRMLILIT